MTSQSYFEAFKKSVEKNAQIKNIVYFLRKKAQIIVIFFLLEAAC